MFVGYFFFTGYGFLFLVGGYLLTFPFKVSSYAPVLYVQDLIEQLTLQDGYCFLKPIFYMCFIIECFFN